MPQQFLAMTMLPEDMERTLIRLPYSTLIKILREKTKISGTDTIYTAVQWISREFTEKEIAKSIDKYKADLDKEEQSPLYSQAPRLGAPMEESPWPVNVPAKVVREPKVDKGNAHPQPLINAKTAAAKAAGGNIQFSRPNKGWLVTKANKTEIVWTSEQFRIFSEKEITDIITSA